MVQSETMPSVGHAKRGPAKTGRVNISDVARLANVSTATVSRVMRDADNVTELTRNKVNRAIHMLGYVPNAHARALTMPSTTVTVVMNRFSGGAYVRLLEGIEEEAMASGMSFRLMISGTRPGGLRGTADDLIAQRPAVAIIVAAGNVDEEQDRVLNERFRQFEDVGTHVVVLGRSRLTLNPGVGVVDYDNERGMHDVTARLIELGHREFLYADRMGRYSHVFDARRAGFLRALGEAGIPHDPRFELQLGEDRAENVSRLQAAWESGVRFTALVASMDDRALDMIVGLRELGLSVPGDVSVSGFDDMPYAGDLMVPLTTVHVPFYEMGRAAVRMGVGNDGLDCVEPVRLVERASIDVPSMAVPVSAPGPASGLTPAR